MFNKRHTFTTYVPGLGGSRKTRRMEGPSVDAFGHRTFSYQDQATGQSNFTTAAVAKGSPLFNKSFYVNGPDGKSLLIRATDHITNPRYNNQIDIASSNPRDAISTPTFLSSQHAPYDTAKGEHPTAIAESVTKALGHASMIPGVGLIPGLAANIANAAIHAGARFHAGRETATPIARATLAPPQPPAQPFVINRAAAVPQIRGETSNNLFARSAPITLPPQVNPFRYTPPSNVNVPPGPIDFTGALSATGPQFDPTLGVGSQPNFDFGQYLNAPSDNIPTLSPVNVVNGIAPPISDPTPTVWEGYTGAPVPSPYAQSNAEPWNETADPVDTFDRSPSAAFVVNSPEDQAPITGEMSDNLWLPPSESSALGEVAGAEGTQSAPIGGIIGGAGLTAPAPFPTYGSANLNNPAINAYFGAGSTRGYQGGLSGYGGFGQTAGPMFSSLTGEYMASGAPSPSVDWTTSESSPGSLKPMAVQENQGTMWENKILNRFSGDEEAALASYYTPQQYIVGWKPVKGFDTGYAGWNTRPGLVPIYSTIAPPPSNVIPFPQAAVSPSDAVAKLTGTNG